MGKAQPSDGNGGNNRSSLSLSRGHGAWIKPRRFGKIDGSLIGTNVRVNGGGAGEPQPR